MVVTDGTDTATRRQIVRRLLAFGGLAATAGGVAVAVDPERALAAPASPESDSELLVELLAAEVLAIAVYEAVIRSGLLSPQPDRTARRALAQERAHVRALLRVLDKLGGTMPPSLSGDAAVDKALAADHVPGRVVTLRTEHDCVSLLLDLEAVVQAAYFKAMSQLQSPGLLRLAAQIMANEAQHSTALSEARRPGNIGQAVPGAFVEGKQ